MRYHEASERTGDGMNTTDAIRHMMKTTGTNPNALSVRMGRSRTYVRNTLSRGMGATAVVLATMADVMGYELVLRGQGEEIVIDPADHPE